MAPIAGRMDIGLPVQSFRLEAEARLKLARAAAIGFAERLTMFWANHFAVSAARSGQVRAVAGAFEREAIRPHVFGRFADMVFAVETHPAMLMYLDNFISIGPTSRAGARRGRGLNENLAREIMELHTLGVDGGYVEADVTSLARIMTGWTVTLNDDRFGRPGVGVFNDNLHEPGAHAVMGRSYPDSGPDQARRALSDLALSPATARHVATKLARHFLADVPPPTLVDRLADAFKRTNGDLAAVSRALIEAPESWTDEVPKIRSPQEFVLASDRLLGPLFDMPRYLRVLLSLGQPLWTPNGPDGYADTLAQWASPEGMSTRLEWAASLGRQLKDVDINAVVDAAFGPTVSGRTREAVLREGDRGQAVAMLLMSPEFQRR